VHLAAVGQSSHTVMNYGYGRRNICKVSGCETLMTRETDNNDMTGEGTTGARVVS
jgi:hypothetical protein